MFFQTVNLPWFFCFAAFDIISICFCWTLGKKVGLNFYPRFITRACQWFSLIRVFCFLVFFLCSDKVHIHINHENNPVIAGQIENICIIRITINFLLFFFFISFDYTGKILTDLLVIFFFIFNIRPPISVSQTLSWCLFCVSTCMTLSLTTYPRTR